MPQDNSLKGYWILVRDTHIHLNDNGQLPYGSAAQCGFAGRKAILIGSYPYTKDHRSTDYNRCNTIKEEHDDNNNPLSPVWLVQADDAEHDKDRAFYSLRSQLLVEEALRNVMHRAVSLNHFFNTHRYCGNCGTAFQLADNETALSCPSCHNRVYPTISPSIIVAIRWGRKILLANHHRSNSKSSQPQRPKIYTTLAGFVEAGENLENAVAREVWEETNIRVKNIQYFGSQSWSFPNTLMLGFLAEYDGGEIHLEDEELADAQWFDCNAPLPPIPPKGTIASELIAATLTLCRAEAKLSE